LQTGAGLQHTGFGHGGGQAGLQTGAWAQVGAEAHESQQLL
jgi:hypothetical protein